MIRPARAADVEAIGELVYLAGQSQYSNSAYDLSIGGTREEQIQELARLAATPTFSWFHYSSFEVAEIDGVVVAGAAGFDRLIADEQLRLVLREAGWSDARITSMESRLGPIFAALPPEPDGFWTIDHVAVLPNWRGRGLSHQCLERVIERGRAAGYAQSKIDIFAGNAPAKRLYESLGYRLEQVFDDPAFRVPLQRDAIERYITRLM